MKRTPRPPKPQGGDKKKRPAPETPGPKNPIPEIPGKPGRDAPEIPGKPGPDLPYPEGEQHPDGDRLIFDTPGADPLSRRRRGGVIPRA